MGIPEAEERGEHLRFMRSIKCFDCGGTLELWGRPVTEAGVLTVRHLPGDQHVNEYPGRFYIYQFDSHRLYGEFKGNLGRIGTALTNEAHPLMPPKRRTGKQTRRG